MVRWVVRHPLLATFAPLALFVLTAGLAVAVHSARTDADRLDDFGPVGTFAFTDKDGRPVTDADLRGKVCIVACFFCCCTESCPQLSGSLARLQAELRHEPDVRLVSVTVDPANDTPQRLAQYAAGYNAVAERWLFLTGGEEAVRAFVQGQLHLGMEKNPADAGPGNRVLHSNKLTLVDRRGHVRGYFDGTDPAAVGALKAAAERLAREGP
jgi:protein SCO1